MNEEVKIGKQIEAIQEFFADEEIDKDWLLRHTEVICGSSRTITITIDNMNEQEYEWISHP